MPTPSQLLTVYGSKLTLSRR